MKWFDKWIMKRAERIMNESQEIQIPETSTNWAIGAKVKHAQMGIRHDSIGDSLDSPAVRFKMFKASGGTIIETTIYDTQRDRTINGLYVVTNDKDLGTEIGKILTLESLKV